jgi:hypothetical protein
MAKITFLSVKDDVPAEGYWDQGFLKDMLSELGDSDRHIFVIPGKNQYDVVDEINEKLNEHEKILVFITSDEECNFDVYKLKHPNMIIYNQCGCGGFMFPLGYPTGTREMLKEIGLQEKKMDYFFAGQNTHVRRNLLIRELSKLKNGEIHLTDGFAKGIGRMEYLRGVAEARTVPCPSGAVSEESFRVYEALEAGSVPIADLISPLRSHSINYWNRLFGSAGFPTYADPSEVEKLIWQVANLQDYANSVQAWWINKKYQFKAKLEQDLDIPKPEMVAVIPVSPIPSHPDTSILEETINSIRHHTGCPIVIKFDGVRKEQEGMRKNYEEFKRRMLWKINLEYKNVLPLIFNQHHHQSGMMRFFLQQSDVPLILYVEQDTPLCTDREIDFEKCKDYIRSGESNVIRFHSEEVIPKEHEYLMIGEPENGFRKTVQWSQRPHLATKDMYEVIMALFSKETNCFIEPKLHGVVQDVWREKGMEGWDKWKIWIYHPEGGIKRSYHLDGRAGTPNMEHLDIY